MKCDHCSKKDMFLEIIGKDMICKTCVQKHRIMGNLFRTHVDTFHFVLRKLKPVDYTTYLEISRKQLDELVNFAKIGVKINTSNVVELE